MPILLYNPTLLVLLPQRKAVIYNFKKKLLFIEFLDLACCFSRVPSLLFYSHQAVCISWASCILLIDYPLFGYKVSLLSLPAYPKWMCNCC
jgi:hypothetical protein